jgi:YafQ family addiction module toxin component
VYELLTKEKLQKELNKLEKRNPVHYNAVIKKLREICVDPGRYKNLNYPLQNLKRVHIGTHFVLLFSVDEATKTVTLEDLKHHDDAY